MHQARVVFLVAVAVTHLHVAALPGEHTTASVGRAVELLRRRRPTQPRPVTCPCSGPTRSASRSWPRSGVRSTARTSRGPSAPGSVPTSCPTSSWAWVGRRPSRWATRPPGGALLAQWQAVRPAQAAARVRELQPTRAEAVIPSQPRVVVVARPCGGTPAGPAAGTPRPARRTTPASSRRCHPSACPGTAAHRGDRWVSRVPRDEGLHPAGQRRRGDEHVRREAQRHDDQEHDPLHRAGGPDLHPDEPRKTQLRQSANRTASRQPAIAIHAFVPIRKPIR